MPMYFTLFFFGISNWKWNHWSEWKIELGNARTIIQCQQTTREFIFKNSYIFFCHLSSLQLSEWAVNRLIRTNELRSMCLNAWPKHLISIHIHVRMQTNTHMRYGAHTWRCLVCLSSHTVKSCSLRRSHTHSLFIFAHIHEHLCVYSNAPTLTYRWTLSWRIASERTHSVIQLKSHAALIVPFFFYNSK